MFWGVIARITLFRMHVADEWRLSQYCIPSVYIALQLCMTDIIVEKFTQMLFMYKSCWRRKLLCFELCCIMKRIQCRLNHFCFKYESSMCVFYLDFLWQEFGKQSSMSLFYLKFHSPKHNPCFLPFGIVP